MDCRNVPIKEIGKVVTGKTPLTSHQEYYDGEYMFITPNELHGEYLVSSSEKTITKAGIESIKSNRISGTSILVGCIGWDMGNVAVCEEDCATNQQINSVTQIKSEYNPLYLYYWLRGKKEYLFSIASVTRTPILSKSVFEEVLVPMPNKDIQDHISEMLSAIDKKIVNNNRINDNLQQQLCLLYEHMMNNAQFGRVCGKYVTVSQLTNVITGKEDANFSSTSGKYKFFTCSNDTLHCDEYIFDSSAVLIAGNGDFNVKHYTGKFNAYQRTYVLIPDKKYYGLLYMASLYQINSFKSASAGSIVKFITKGDIENIQVFIPEDNSKLHEFNQLLNLQEQNQSENDVLSSLRDWLLPMLMNGQASVDD